MTTDRPTRPRIAPHAPACRCAFRLPPHPPIRAPSRPFALSPSRPLYSPALAERDGRERLRATRGKSELHRVDCQVTPGRRKATDRATENRPPVGQPAGKGETVG